MQTPLKNVTTSFLATPSNNWRPAKSPVFEKLLGGYAPPSVRKDGWGAHYMTYFLWRECAT